MKKYLVGAAVAAIASLAIAGTASAHERTTYCGGSISHSKTFYESKVALNEVTAHGTMNCTSARYAVGRMWQQMRQQNYRVPRTYSDGYVRWHRTLMRRLWGPKDGCGDYGWLVRYREYSSGTAFSVLLTWEGC